MSSGKETDGDLLWVNSTLSGASKDAPSRNRIRKHVMKRLSEAWKQEGKFKDRNRRQYPPILPSNLVHPPRGGTPSEVIDQTGRHMQAAARSSTYEWGANVAQWLAVEHTHVRPNPVASDSLFSPSSCSCSSSSPSAPPYERVVSDFMTATLSPSARFKEPYYSLCVEHDLNLCSLSYLTSLEVSRNTARFLKSAAFDRRLLFGRRHLSSYLFHLPRRYGENFCLTDAVHCIAARTRCFIAPNGQRERYATLSYGKALRSLQQALDNAEQRLRPDVLCATALLGLYELLNTTKEDAWIRHVTGTTTLLRLRGPKAYKTDFEKTLLFCQLGPIITEAILSNQGCFVEEPEWQDIIRSMITDDEDNMPERSQAVISLTLIVVMIPRLFRDTTILVRGQEHKPTQLKRLVARIRSVRSALSRWETEHLGPLLESLDKGTLQPPYINTVGMFTVSVIWCNRCMAAVSWDMPSVLGEAEKETQSYAARVLSIQRQMRVCNAPTYPVLKAHKLSVAEATVVTKPDWQMEGEDVVPSPGEGRSSLVPRWIFERWCELFGRQTSC